MNFAKFPEKLPTVCKIFRNFKKSRDFEFGAVQKLVNLVDLEKCCKMSIYLPKSALIQPRTSRPKLPDRSSGSSPSGSRAARPSGTGSASSPAGSSLRLRLSSNTSSNSMG